MGIGFGRGENADIEIEMGTPAAEIAEQLKESGAVKIPFLFRTYAKLKHYDSQFKYGVYVFNLIVATTHSTSPNKSKGISIIEIKVVHSTFRNFIAPSLILYQRQ